MNQPSVSPDSIESQIFDCLVVGSGAVGGLATALLCEAGLKVLVLDAGLTPPFAQAPLQRTTSAVLAALVDPRILDRLPRRVVWRGELIARRIGRRRQPVQSQCYAWPSAPDLFVDDIDNPYETDPDAPFNWVRARGIGGRMVVPLHGRQYYRHSRYDFRPTDGLSPPWPFEPGELDAFYEHVEGRVGLSGAYEGSEWIPDSKLAEHRAPNTVEADILATLGKAHPDYKPVLGRYAKPYDGIAAARATGNLSIRQGAVAAQVLTAAQQTTGVRFFDRSTRQWMTARAPIVMLGAGALESTRILLNSVEEGLRTTSDSLGAHLMDHVSLKAQGIGPDLGNHVEQQNLGKCIYLPRFDTRNAKTSETRGYGVRLYLNAAQGGISYFTAVADGEMTPRKENRVTLSARKDKWGIPALHIRATYSALEHELSDQQYVALKELAERLDVRLENFAPGLGVPGSAIHECGTARMGTDPADSVLDPHNRYWGVKGLYVTDGSSFPSEGLQNPTLTMMALTARACALIAAG